MAITDESPMPFGKYKGVKMANVPASYLIFIFNEGYSLPKELFDYIIDNMDLLKKESDLSKN